MTAAEERARAIQPELSFSERFRELRDLGYNDLIIADRLGIRPESMLRQMLRYGIAPSQELAEAAHQSKYRKKVSA